MTDEEYERYLADRYSKLVQFYDHRAQTNKIGHRVCSVFIIAISAALAPLISTGVLLTHAMVGGFLSASVAGATAIASYFQFNENWLNYRKTWDTLQREPHLRDAQVGDYANSSDRNALFVERIEAIASDEGVEWFSRHVRRQQNPTGSVPGGTTTENQGPTSG